MRLEFNSFSGATSQEYLQFAANISLASYDCSEHNLCYFSSLRPSLHAVNFQEKRVNLNKI